MIRWHVIVLVVAVIAAILGGAHYYIYSRLLRAVGGPRGGVLWVVRGATVALALSFPLTHILLRGATGRLAAALNGFAAVWLGLLLYLFLFTLLFHATASIGRLSGIAAHIPSAWSRHAGPAAALAVSCIALGLGGWGIYQARYGTVTTDIEAPMKSLPRDLDGFTIVQISDIHVGAIIGFERMRAIVNRVNSLHPDLVVITGDLVDEEAADLAKLAPALAGLRAPHGVLAVSGNHDAMAGILEVVEAAERGGVRFLRNERTVVAGAISVYGIDDPAADRAREDTAAAFERIIGPEALREPSILLYHRPLQPSIASRLGIDLMLSGHTHRGQMWPLSYVSRIFFPFQAGAYRIGKTLLYVSRGVGTWGPPMRIASRPEIVRITLRSRS